jgi:hypothetical protein
MTGKKSNMKHICCILSNSKGRQVKVECKVVPIHTVKTYGGADILFQSILILVVGRGEWSDSLCRSFTAGWAPGLVWAIVKKGKSLDPSGI